MFECACVGGGEGAHWQSAYEMLDGMKAFDIGNWKLPCHEILT